MEPDEMSIVQKKIKVRWDLSVYSGYEQNAESNTASQRTEGSKYTR
jgi:hypothetical protein